MGNETLIVCNLKILKWDPDNPSICDTTFTYSLSSAQKKNCNVTIQIFSTEGAKVYETTLTQLCPGSYSFTWDGTMNKVGMPPPTTAPRGLYTFNIIVQGACPYDMDQMRSQSLKITDHEATWLGGTPIDRGATDLYYIRYRLQDSKPPYKAGVRAYTPDLDFIGEWEDGTALTPLWNDFGERLLKVPSPVCGTYRFVFWAIDDHIETDKAHRRKPTLEVNKGELIASGANCYISDKIWGDTCPAAAAAAKYQKMAGYKKWKWWTGNKFQVEEMILKANSALDIIKPLRRVALFSWQVHGLDKSLGGVIPFGNDWLVPSRSFLRSILPRLGYSNYTVPDTGPIYINGKRVYCVDELFTYDPNTGAQSDLSNIVCAFLINCSADEVYGNIEVIPWGSLNMLYEMARTHIAYDKSGNQIYLRGANCVATIVGGAYEDKDPATPEETLG
ncbi:MAG: hypothetical protein ACP5QS_08965, partial [bacterium]